MKYQGYTGKVTYDEDAKIFHGEIVGIKDVITFEGSSVDELEKAFHDSVNDYLDFCEELKRKPEKPFSGKLLLRINPEIHEQIAYEARMKGQSLNTWIQDTIINILTSHHDNSHHTHKR